MLTQRIIAGGLSVAMIVLVVSVASAQNYPSKPIRIYTGDAGGNNDNASRLIASGISGPLGQSVIVENRSALISVDVVAKAPADGYSLVVSGNLIWLGPLLFGQVDAMRDFAPISILASQPNILVVHPSLPVKSVKDLIALAKARPGELNYSMGPVGGTDHLGAELFKSMAGIKVERIAYKGASAATIALIGGEVQLMFGGVFLVNSNVKAGRVRALAVTSPQPSILAPGLPTMAASGLPGYELDTATAIYAPAKTPSAIINQLNREIVRFLKTKEAQEKYLTLGAEVIASSPEEHAAILKSRMAAMTKVIKDAGIKVE